MIYDLIVVGGGVVGLAVLRQATLDGWSCACIEREADLLAHASGSNSGIVCTGVDAAVGTLERALLRDSISQIRLFCKAMNIPIRQCGSLVCQWPGDDDRLEDVLQESQLAGDTHAARLTAKEVLDREPFLNASCLGAVHIPGEIVVDPWLYSIALAVHARQNGATIFTSFEMDPSTSTFDGQIWTIRRLIKDGADTDAVQQLQGRAVVNAAGLWADIVQQPLGKATWRSQPRRGQYCIYETQSVRLTHPIQPVPTQFTKGVFVFSTMYDQLVVGPTAQDQDSRTDRSIDSGVSEQLAEHAKRILPSLDVKTSKIGDYIGLRPGTDKRDYQIHLDYLNSWIACAGIRSTGR